MDSNINPRLFQENSKYGQMNSTESANLSSRKNSIPASNLSLTSTSSASSSINSPTSKFFGPKSFYSLNSSRHNSNKHDSSTSPQSSRRQSGNSITIKIISENNDTVWDDSIKESDLNTFDEEEVEREREYQKDRDEGEDTSSNSIDYEYSPGGSGKHKKLKERKKLIRSSAQQQHHLIYQESEDLVEEQPTYHEFKENLTKNMNSAFDELFAAAESGNSSVSAMIEAKMAAQTASVVPNDTTTTLRPSGSFRQNYGLNRTGGSFKYPRKTDEKTNSRSTLNENSNRLKNNLKSDCYLGSPKQLTRSCSCKRPSSFKKMRSKNASPNRPLPNNESAFANTEPNWDITPPESNSRRETQFSINANPGRRTSSLPFESFIGPQIQTMLPNDEETEVYRVRQFVTKKGSVINRGDSFKRSFKRSTQSISSNSKKDTSPTFQDTNTLNLPDFQDGNSLVGNGNGGGSNQFNETSFVNSEQVSYDKVTETNQIIPPIVVQNQEAIKTYVVYILGASTVGKNALLKQFKTSEYRGIYEISNTSPNGKKIFFILKFIL